MYMKHQFQKSIIIYFFIFISLFINYSFYSQNKTIDSLLTILKTDKSDTIFVKNLIKISNKYAAIANYLEAKKFAQKAINKSKLINQKKSILNAYTNFGSIYFETTDYDSSLIMYKLAIENVDSINNKAQLANLLIRVAELYYRKGDFNLNVYYCVKSLKLFEQVNDTNGMISGYNGIAVNYLVQGNYEKALETYLKILNLAIKINNSKQIANTYNSIGVVYLNKKNYQKALFYYFKSLECMEKYDFKKGIIVSLNNISGVYIIEKKYKEAIEIAIRALKIGEEIGNKNLIAESYQSISDTYEKLGDLEKAEEYVKKALKLNNEIGDKASLQKAYLKLENLFEKKGDYKQALYYQKLYTIINDTLYNTESSKQIAEMNTKYETEKKDKELIKKDAEINMQQIQTEKQAVIKNSFIIGFIFLLGLIIFIYRGYVQKRKTNLLLNDKNQKITDSINYAKIIQSSILPSFDELKKHLPESFIFYQPKDIVSGDFYWLYPVSDSTVIFAVVDCTGHGVPGALMSMLGYSLLEQIINQQKIEKPSEILDQLNYLVIESLKQSENGDTVKNGMDMIIFKLDYSNYELEFAGAKNPLYVIRNQNLIELKGDRKSIGLSSSNTNLFTNQTLKLQQGDHLYAFSDGYVDQKGGTENKKFYSANFQKLLISISALKTDEQQNQIERAYTNWKGSKEQVDDVLVFGVKV